MPNANLLLESSPSRRLYPWPFAAEALPFALLCSHEPGPLACRTSRRILTGGCQGDTQYILLA
jgi:hypothetical protein